MHCFDALGNKKWQFPFPRGTDPNTKIKYTFSAPKILDDENLNTVIFMTMITTEEAHTCYYLLAVNQEGTLLKKRQHSSYPTEPLTGSTDWGVSGIQFGILSVLLLILIHQAYPQQSPSPKKNI